MEPGAELADRRPGLHFTRDDGKTWKATRAAGLEGDPIAVAVHPDDAKLVAAATSRGVFESADAGESFRRIGADQGTAVHYDLDGKHLWYGSFDGKAPLLARAVPRGGPPAAIGLPKLDQDAVSFIAQNPTRHDEYAFATFRRSVFVSKDGGKSWVPIADQGKGL